MGKGSPPPDTSGALQEARFAREDTAAAKAKADADAATLAQHNAFYGAPARDATPGTPMIPGVNGAPDTPAVPGTPASPATTGSLENAINSARGAASSTLASRHLSTDEFMPLIENELMRVKGTIPDTSTNPGTYFGPDLADTVLNREQSNRRTNYTNTLNQTFTPTYAQGQWSDAADDPILTSILGEASGTAQSAIERAKARGQLDDTGYTAAINRLGQSTTTGMAKAQTLGHTVIDRDRQALEDIANQGRTAASSYTLGGSFDPKTYSDEASSLYGTQKGTFEGDVRGAVGDPNQFYDIGSIIDFGGREQGAQNPTSSPLADVLAQRETARTARRGLGSTGTF